MKLYVKILKEELSEDECELVTKFYQNHKCNHKDDSGVDLVCPRDVTIEAGETVVVNLGISCQPDGNHGYYLFSRSSTPIKTPLRVGNCTGIIDMGYRGPICVIFDNIKDYDWTIKAGDRLAQLCAPDLTPVKIELVEELDDSQRGEGGLGSTG